MIRNPKKLRALLITKDLENTSRRNINLQGGGGLTHFTEAL